MEPGARGELLPSIKDRCVPRTLTLFMGRKSKIDTLFKENDNSELYVSTGRHFFSVLITSFIYLSINEPCIFLAYVCTFIAFACIFIAYI